MEGVKIRLEDEVQNYFTLLDYAARQGQAPPHAGLWAGVRLLMPIVETLGKTYYPTKRFPQGYFLKTHLGIPCPSVVWNMYRHALIHGDFLRIIQHRDIIFHWGVSRKGEHKFKKGHINIDVEKLCKDLLGFINAELSSNNDLKRPVDVIVGIQDPPHFIASELDQLFTQSDVQMNLDKNQG